MKKILTAILLLVILIPVLILGLAGFIPGLSPLLGAGKPRDLGVKYKAEDFVSARSKSQLIEEALPKNTPPETSLVWSGSKDVNKEFSSSEITASLNNQSWIYWPIKNVQAKFNADGSIEMSGSLIKSRIPSYCAFVRIPQPVVEFVMKFLPPDPAFYLKGRASLVDNKVAVFEPLTLQINRITLPMDMILSKAPILIPSVYAESGNMLDQLSQVENKKGLIIQFINQRLGEIPGFYAKNAYFAENKLVFEGKLNEKIQTAQ